MRTVGPRSDRPASRFRLFLEHLAWTTLGILSWEIYARLNLTFLTEPVIGDWLSVFPYVYFWLNLPLAIVLSCGWLLRRKSVGRAVLTAASGERTPKKWPLGMPAWLGVQVTLGAGAAGLIDVLLMMGGDLGRSSDWHWLLFPWGEVGIAVFVVSVLREALYPEASRGMGTRAPKTFDAITYLWDWFGDAVVAAVFSSLLLVALAATLFGDLTRDELPDYVAAAGVALLPLCCMFFRHVAVSVLRRSRSMARRPPAQS